jgi:hypothetical protein
LITDNVNRTVPYQYWSEYSSTALLQCGQSGPGILGSGAAHNPPQGQGSGIQPAVLIAG